MSTLDRPLRHRLRGASQRLVDRLFPPSCLACAAPLGLAPSPTLLCTPCRGRLVPIFPAARCSGCLAPAPEPRSAASPRCARCLVDPPPFERLVAAWLYQPPLSEAILALKFRRLDFLSAALAALAWTREPLAAEERFDLVVPIPLAPLRRLQRGFNQSSGIAGLFARRLGIPTSEALRPGTFASTAQSRLGRRARQAPRRRRFAVHDANRFTGKRILLIDDVVTTGATLRAGAAALRSAGASAVIAFALAATPDRAP